MKGIYLYNGKILKRLEMMMLKKGSLTGLLLFGMFFGAGNLIFPPQLGLESGQNFGPALEALSYQVSVLLF